MFSIRSYALKTFVIRYRGFYLPSKHLTRTASVAHPGIFPIAIFPSVGVVRSNIEIDMRKISEIRKQRLSSVNHRGKTDTVFRADANSSLPGNFVPFDNNFAPMLSVMRLLRNMLDNDTSCSRNSIKFENSHSVNR